MCVSPGVLGAAQPRGAAAPKGVSTWATESVTLIYTPWDTDHRLRPFRTEWAPFGRNLTPLEASERPPGPHHPSSQPSAGRSRRLRSAHPSSSRAPITSSDRPSHGAPANGSDHPRAHRATLVQRHTPSSEKRSDHERPSDSGETQARGAPDQLTQLSQRDGLQALPRVDDVAEEEHGAGGPLAHHEDEGAVVPPSETVMTAP
jgi:hypothetical protein